MIRLIVLLFAAICLPAAGADADKLWIDAWSRTLLSTTVTRSTTSVQSTVPTQFANQTYRLMAFTTVGGSQVRVKLSNGFSTAPLVIGAAHIALRDKNGSIRSSSDHALFFKGRRTVTLDPGTEAWSDAVNLKVAQHTDVAISIYLPQTFTATAFHPTGLKTAYLSKPGNFTAARTMPMAGTEPTTTMLFFVSQIQVLAVPSTRSIVALGDSITDGACSDVDVNGSWPDLLSKRLATRPNGSSIAVINAGIGSNRFVTSDGAGLRGLNRLPELLQRNGVAWLILFEGVNDISYEHIAPDDLIAAYQAAIDQAHAAHIKVIGIPLLPFGHSVKDVGDNKKTRAAINNWIRTSHAYDQIIDFEPVLADPADPLSIKAELTCDHVHPNQAGYEAMADAIDIALFK